MSWRAWRTIKNMIWWLTKLLVARKKITSTTMRMLSPRGFSVRKEELTKKSGMDIVDAG
jgi:hypothetical protein